MAEDINLVWGCAGVFMLEARRDIHVCEHPKSALRFGKRQTFQHRLLAARVLCSRVGNIESREEPAQRLMVGEVAQEVACRR